MRLRFPRPSRRSVRRKSVVITELRDGRRADIFNRGSGTFDPAAHPLPDGARSYVICFVQRSGSTMLRTLLTQTGGLGKPEEFLNPRGVMQRHVESSGAGNLSDYFRYLRTTMSSPAGLFGMKASWQDFQPLVDGGLTT